jgi:hypothetical protein
MKRIVLIITIIALTLPISAKKYSYKLSAKNAETEEVAEEENEMVAGSFMVASQCEACNNGYRLDEISFSGYDKPQSSTTESFFITNHTDRVLTGVTLYIDYRDKADRQLHKQFLKLSCEIPPGETRQATLKSWDTQRSFYYEKSAASKRVGSAFEVKLDLVAYYLRF